MPSYIKVSFQDDNPAGANDNDGWKVYKNVGSDPCPNGVIDPSKEVYHETSPTPGTGVVEYTDVNVAANNSYYYRASFTRGADEALNTLGPVGPITLANVDDLGYPNNLPSNTSGVAFTADVEPMFHFDAQREHTLHGNGFVYSTVDTTLNRPLSYPTADGFNVKPGANASRALHIQEWDSPNNPTGTPIPVVSDHPNGVSPFYWAATYYPTGNAPNYLWNEPTRPYDNMAWFDLGTTCIDVILPIINNTTYDYWGTSRSNMFQGQSTLAGGYDVWLYSDLKNLGAGNVTSPGKGKDIGLFHPGTTAACLGAQIYNGKTVSFCGEAATKGGALGTPLPASTADGDMSVVVSRVMPDSSQKIWVDGSKELDRGPTTHVDGNGAGPFTPMPGIKFANNGWSPMYGMSTKIESLIFPEALTNADIQRVISYIYDRYDGYVSAPQPYTGF